MSGVKIIDLPAEILEKIFGDFSMWDDDTLINLTQVCRKFNDVIGASSKLMDELTIFWYGDNLQDTRSLMQSRRKYRNISLHEVTALKPSLMTFICDHTFMLSSLHLYECALQTSDFGLLLKNIAKNLTTISMCSVNFVEDHDPFPIEFTQLKWIELMYGGGNGYFSVFDFFKGNKSVTVS